LTEQAPIPIRAAGWAIMDTGVQVVLSLIMLVCVGRYLTPTQLGSVALAQSFVTMAGDSIDALFSRLVTQDRTMAGDRLDVAFTLSFAISIGVMASCWLAAPMMASVPGADDLPLLFATMALVLPIRSALAVVLASMRQDLRFKDIALRNSMAQSFGTICGIVAAVFGLGAWSIVAQQWVAVLALAIAVHLLIPHWPRPNFHISALRGRFSFVVSSLIMQLIWIANLRLFLGGVGWVLGAPAVGEIGLAMRMVDTLSAPLVGAVDNAAVSVFARLREDRPAFVRLFTSAVRWTSAAGFLIATGLFCLADVLVPPVLGDRWAGVVIPLRILCAYSLFRHAMLYWGNAMIALGRPQGCAIWAASNLLLTAAGLMFLPSLGTRWAALIWLGQLALSVPLAIVLVRRATGLSPRDLISPLGPVIAASLAMVGGIYGFRYLWEPQPGLIPAVGFGLIGVLVYGLVIRILVGDPLIALREGLRERPGNL
jgi:O-antigen/teichoic acid export membrane protein